MSALRNFSAYFRLARLNQPTGIWLLFLPCLFGIFLALKNRPDLGLIQISEIIGFFLAGSILMRSAGCVLNDIIDEKFDKKVARTKTRPIAADEISRKSAFAFLGILLFLSLLILLQFNKEAIFGGFFSLILVAIYPLTKRFTYFPQVFLGLTFNFGILLSSLAILEKITPPALLLYFAMIIWTVIYDSIYAFQDIEDDLKIGVKSTAIKFQKNPKLILLSLNMAMLSFLLFLGFIKKFHSGFFVTILVSTLFLSHKIRDCDLKNSKDCMNVFKANIWIGSLILLGIILG